MFIVGIGTGDDGRGTRRGRISWILKGKEICARTLGKRSKWTAWGSVTWIWKYTDLATVVATEETIGKAMTVMSMR